MRKKTSNQASSFPTPAEINTAMALFGSPDIAALWKLCSKNSHDGNIARISLALEQIVQNGSHSKSAEELKTLLEQRLACLQMQAA